jgi:hypothetical protein
MDYISFVLQIWDNLIYIVVYQEIRRLLRW